MLHQISKDSENVVVLKQNHSAIFNGPKSPGTQSTNYNESGNIWELLHGILDIIIVRF